MIAFLLRLIMVKMHFKRIMSPPIIKTSLICRGRGFLFVLFILIAFLDGRKTLPDSVKYGDEAEMVFVPAGSFLMGSEEDEEAPLHSRYLNAFYIDRYEVSNAQYAKFVAETGYPPPPHWKGKVPPPGEENLPVTNVSWFDAMRYAIWAGKRLPTEAEWEKAARGTAGRKFPWGNQDEPTRRNLSTDILEPVDTFPQGISPYGCFNMAGNVWEWTADWYDAYPGSHFKSPHFGKKYKVIKGGGAIGIYPIPNTGHCAQRARLLPYGYYDGVGFRCVKDVSPQNAPYDPLKLLQEAEKMLNRPLPPSFPLSYEKEFQDYLNKGCIPIKIDGAPGQGGYVRAGIPFPKGLLDDLRRLRISTPQGVRPLQAKQINLWEDGSISWALLDFPAKAGETLELLILPRRDVLAYPYPLVSMKQEGEITVDTGKLILRISKDNFLEVQGKDGKMLIKGLDISLKLLKEGREISIYPYLLEKIEVEEGSLHSIICLKGRFAKEDGSLFPFLYDIEIHAFSNSTNIHLSLRLTHYAPREEEPLLISSIRLRCLLNEKLSKAILGGDGEEIELPFDNEIELVQERAWNYKIKADGRLAKEGIRADGWESVKLGKVSIIMGVRHFWENHPIALFVTYNSVGLNLWAGKEPLEWEGGLAKTYDIYLDFPEGKSKWFSQPLVAILPPAWIAGTKVLGDLLPKGEESLRLFPYWEAMLENSGRKWARGMATGMRDFGDAYYGGPYKGKNSYANLEYDTPLNFLIQFLRTGERWYMDVGEAQVRHQRDIDIDHYTGRQWKHSPLHTTTEADLGHIFLRGLLLHYLLTGERRSLESAEEIGKWLTPRVERLEGMGNERQIGWSLYALCELYKVTRNKTYLTAGDEASIKLAKGQSPTGRFNIRWDNRISFFNGIAMTGLLNVYLLTGREEIYQAVHKLAQRTLGFYPEYACRTLDALSYLAEKTKDPRFWDLIERTWETSMDYLLPRNALPAGTFSWQFIHFMGKYRFPFLISDLNEPKISKSTGWRSLRLKGEKIELLPQGKGILMIILEGLEEGDVTVYDGQGKIKRRYELKGEKIFKRATIHIEGGYKVLLLSSQRAIWEVHYEPTIELKIYDPDFVNLPNIYPKAYCDVAEGAKLVRLRVRMEGEGFHKAVIYEPEGRIVAVGEKFIDLGDVNAYEMEITAPVKEGIPRKGWAVEIYDCDVLEVEGLSPLVSAGF